MEILVCVDDDGESKQVINKAADFAEETGADVTLIHSYTQDVEYSDGQPVKESAEDAEMDGQTILENARSYAESQGLTPRVTLVEAGDSAVNAIVSFINENEYNYLFLGHRALDSRHQKAFGSFAKDMISHCPIPVIVASATSEE